ncbi:hypothetical protein [Deinococcus hopiensis]|uniref:hypothetical protein n=1 Tax=Deinococcus hopiensis TaxID=309885 RepID=UPI0009FD5F86|nr:hypothetical protein [Deinococcus hopiensis]
MTLGLSACTTSSPGGPAPNPTQPAPRDLTPGTPNPTNPGGQPTAGFITGPVISAQGQPRQGVEVVADNTLAYNGNLITHTDAAGHRKTSVNGMPTNFEVSNCPPYNPKVSLVPDGNAVVPGDVGGVMNFTMRPNGFKPKP